MKKVLLVALVLGMSVAVGFAADRIPTVSDNFSKVQAAAIAPVQAQSTERGDLLYTLDLGFIPEALLCGIAFDETLGKWWVLGGFGPWSFYLMNYAGTTYTQYVTTHTWYTPLDCATADANHVVAAPYDWEGYPNELFEYVNGSIVDTRAQITWWSPTAQDYDFDTGTFWVAEAWSGAFHNLTDVYPGTTDTPYADSLFLYKIGFASAADGTLWVFSQNGAGACDFYAWDLTTNDYTGDVWSGDGTLGIAGGSCIFNDPTYGSVMAGLHQGTPDVIAVYDYGLSPFPKIDIRANGENSNVEVYVGGNVDVTIAVEARDFAGYPVELWVVGRNMNSGNMFTYGHYPNSIWKAGLCNWYFIGGMQDLSETVLSMPLPLGDYEFYLAVDLYPNGQINLPFIWNYDVVDVHVVKPPTEYKWDDGSTENLLCWTYGGDMVGMHRFDVIPGGENLVQLGTIFGSKMYPGYAPGNGTPTDFYVWDDTSENKVPDGCNLIYWGTGVVSNVDLDIHAWDAIGATVTTNDFWCAYNLHHGSYQYCLSIDGTTPYVAGNAYYTGTNTMYGFDPYNLYANQYPPSETAWGYWTVRAKY